MWILIYFNIYMIVLISTLLHILVADLVDVGLNHTVSDKLTIQMQLTSNSLIFKVFSCVGLNWLGISLQPDMQKRDAAILQLDSSNNVVISHYFMTGNFRPDPSSLNLYTLNGFQISGNCVIAKFTRDNTKAGQDGNTVKQTSYRLSFGYSSTKQMTQHSSLLYTDATFKIGSATVYQAGGGVRPDVIHGIIMTIAWVGLALFSILLIRYYKFKQNFFKAHGISLLVANILTIAMIIYSIYTTFNQTLSPYWAVHKVLGYILLGFTLLAQLLGYVKLFASNRKDTDSKFLVILNLFHRGSGYLAFLVAMEQVIAGWAANDMIAGAIVVGVMVLIFTGAVIYLQMDNPRWVQISNLQSEKGDKVVTRSSCVFQDYVYQLPDQFQFKHPGGNKIIQFIRGREVDRFIYGMYGIQNQLNSPPYLHSMRALEFLQKVPTSKLFQKEDISGKFTLTSIVKLTSDTYIYGFKGKAWSPLQSIAELGKYYCIYDQHKSYLKRLYTQTKFLHSQHYQKLPEKVKQDFKGFNSGVADFAFIAKVYNKGQFTQKLHGSLNYTFQIAGPRGQGLNLRTSGPGNYMVIAGGTGLFPFMDLLWMISTEKEQLRGYNFSIFLRFRGQQNIYFKNFLGSLQKKTSKLCISYQGSQSSFQNEIKEELNKRGNMQAIYVCGPPGMNYEIPRMLKSEGVHAQKIKLL